MLLWELDFQTKEEKNSKRFFQYENEFDLHNLHDCDAVKKISKTILNEHDERWRIILGLDSFCNWISINERKNSNKYNSSSIDKHWLYNDDINIGIIEFIIRWSFFSIDDKHRLNKIGCWRR